MKIYELSYNYSYAGFNLIGSNSDERGELLLQISNNEIKPIEWKTNIFTGKFQQTSIGKKLKKNPDICIGECFSDLSLEKIPKLRELCNLYEIVTDSKKKKYYFFNCPNKIDCLDFDKSIVDCDYKNGLYSFKRYEFDMSKMNEDSNLIFTIPQTLIFFVNDKFAKAVIDNCLVGFHLKNIWNSDGSELEDIIT